MLSCRPSEVEAGFSFVGLADLLGEVVDDVLPDVPRPQRRALEAALGRSEVEGERADEGLVAFAFLTALRTLAQRQRLLLAIDDVQWLDAPSLSMLRYALPRLEEEPVAALLAARDAVPPWLPRAIPPERLSTVELGPLSLGALHELLRIRTGTAFPRPILLRIGETSGGNPFGFIDEGGTDVHTLRNEGSVPAETMLCRCSPRMPRAPICRHPETARSRNL